MNSPEPRVLSDPQATRHFWRDRRVLLTGHTGFKGGWLALWLRELGARVTGLALPPPGEPNLFTLARVGVGIDSRLLDIRDRAALTDTVRAAAPEVVFHLAAQPLVRASYADPVGTYATNVQGTAHLLDALRSVGVASAARTPRVAIMVTTDKVYRNQSEPREHPWPYREDDALGGHDPYSASKAASELVIASYRDAFLAKQGVAVASARAGNVIGGGDWSADRLIPDAIRAWSAGQVLHIRRPEAIRPWQHVLEPLSGYLRLAERLWADSSLAGAYNFGPATHEAASVREVIEQARTAWGQEGTEPAVTWGDGHEGPHEAGWLALETAKVRVRLGVQPRWSLREGIERTLAWYRRQHQGADARDLCLADIAAFTRAHDEASP